MKFDALLTFSLSLDPELEFLFRHVTKTREGEGKLLALSEKGFLMLLILALSLVDNFGRIQAHLMHVRTITIYALSLP